jgi:mannose-6-phosphate isomerase
MVRDRLSIYPLESLLMPITISRLENPIMPYAWGSRTAIAGLLNRIPSDEPEAELWMGAHPKAPSLIAVGDEWIPLDQAIIKDPVAFLGEAAALKHGTRLPFLFKVLAVDQPLSIQAHPDKDHAKVGYALENRLQINVESSKRNYRDDNHKPECICAINPFWAMVGFRPFSEIASLFKMICPGAIQQVAPLKKAFKKKDLSNLYRSLMTLKNSEKRNVIEEAVLHAKNFMEKDPAFDWIPTLHSHYPDDIGVISPLLLNVVMLQPGEALFLPPGTLHAYLKGVGIELMANSDNVLRGGLTVKNVDVKALFKVAIFESISPRVLNPVPVEAGISVYPSEVDDFELSVFNLEFKSSYRNEDPHGIEIFLVTRGSVLMTDEGNQRSLSLGQGQSALIPSVVSPYRIEGEGILYRASVRKP